MKMKHNFLVMVLLLVIFSACSKKEDVAPKEQPKQITLKQGMLVFPDEKSFDETLALLAKSSREQADAWEAAHHFTSQRNIFDKIIDAENKYDEACYKLKPE